ncbi:DNA polymerase lambda, fingers domain [Pseudocohnilembus persalinus]|uniref:DNA-directed DNA polymerase n=1 Tax=Pseudocohnilembus persalinus TaxID=266149 RepID=A0A0V0R1S3_PSEPJ|nr:DNA polymerase lambda, fingers domain [Pseudocohnilembus persalinus]|eukprot:KRX08433.1 DNA polymerase lambda, fingers domain [Pseudocohnilembus persalinus]
MQRNQEMIGNSIKDQNQFGQIEKGLIQTQQSEKRENTGQNNDQVQDSQFEKEKQRIFQKILKETREVLAKEWRVLQILEIHIDMIANVCANLWMQRIHLSKNQDEGLIQLEISFDKTIKSFKNFQNQIKEILKSSTQCQNKVISCQFQGTYREYLDHILEDCQYEFNKETCILRICEKQKQYSENQKQFFLRQKQKLFRKPYILEHKKLDEEVPPPELYKVPTILVANFPQVGMVELFRKFGPIEKFHFDSKNNLIFYVTYKQQYSQQMALEQLGSIEIQGKKLRVTQFMEKEILKKCRLFVKGLQTNDEQLIKRKLEDQLGLPITQCSLLNCKNSRIDASAFVQFEEKDVEIVQGFVDKVITVKELGKRVQFKAYRPKEDNPKIMEAQRKCLERSYQQQQEPQKNQHSYIVDCLQKQQLIDKKYYLLYPDIDFLINQEQNQHINENCINQTQENEENLDKKSLKQESNQLDTQFDKDLAQNQVQIKQQLKQEQQYYQQQQEENQQPECKLNLKKYQKSISIKCDYLWDYNFDFSEQELKENKQKYDQKNLDMLNFHDIQNKYGNFSYENGLLQSDKLEQSGSQFNSDSEMSFDSEDEINLVKFGLFDLDEEKLIQRKIQSNKNSLKKQMILSEIPEIQEEQLIQSQNQNLKTSKMDEEIVDIQKKIKDQNKIQFQFQNQNQEKDWKQFQVLREQKQEIKKDELGNCFIDYMNDSDIEILGSQKIEKKVVGINSESGLKKNTVLEKVEKNKIVIDLEDEKCLKNLKFIDLENDEQTNQQYKLIEQPIVSRMRQKEKYWDKEKEKFQCVKGGSLSEKEIDPNSYITDELDKLFKIYSADKNEQWRAFAYRKALSAIKNHGKKINKIEDIKDVPGIGNKILKKIKEILETGELQKAKNMSNEEKYKVVSLLCGVWGIGETTGEQLYQRGIKTIKQLRRNQHLLNKNQIIGLKYYEDLQQRIPRKEVEVMIQFVQRAVQDLETEKNQYELITCGSYRRGKETCGDVDILLTRRDGVYDNKFMENLIKLLTDEYGMLTDHLVVPKLGSHGSMTYMGIALVDQIHRRIDIKLYPREQYGYAVLYFTGSDFFNRSMRLFARKKGYTLSDHGMSIAKRVKNEKIWQGDNIACFTEEDVFKVLNLPYKKPEERNV